MKLPMLILTGAMFVPAALKTFWPQTSEDIPHFSSHTFLRTEISEEERLSLRARRMEQRAAYQCTRVQPIGALRFWWRDATRRLWSLPTAQEARRAKASEVQRKGNAPHATESSSFYCNRSEFPANARGTRRLEQNEWLVSVLLFIIILRKHFASRVRCLS